MLTNKQLIIIGAIAIALTALIMGCPLEQVVRALELMIGIGG